MNRPCFSIIQNSHFLHAQANSHRNSHSADIKQITERLDRCFRPCALASRCFPGELKISTYTARQVPTLQERLERSLWSIATAFWPRQPKQPCPLPMAAGYIVPLGYRQPNEVVPVGGIPVCAFPSRLHGPGLEPPLAPKSAFAEAAEAEADTPPRRAHAAGFLGPPGGCLGL